MIFVLLQIFATLILLFHIWSAVVLYNIQVNMDLTLSMMIGLSFIAAATLLSLHSLPYFVLFGSITCAFTAIVNFLGKAQPLPGILASGLSFLFWPQFICFGIFAIQHLEEFRNRDDE